MTNNSLRDKSVVVTGSLAFDHIMSLPAKFDDYIMPDKVHMLNVSFVVDTFRREKGGTAGNIAYALAMLGVKPKLVSGAGNDFEEYGQYLKLAGVDVSKIVIDKTQASASGFVMTDRSDNQIWSFFPGPLERAREVGINGDEGFVLLAPTVKEAMVAHLNEVVAKKIEFGFDPAFYIPTLSKSVLIKGVKHAKIIFGNDYEIEMLGRRLGKKVEDLMKKGQIVVTTLGAKGARVYADGKNYLDKAAKANAVSDPTGAGDAFRGGFLAGWLAGRSLSVCSRMGSVSASFAIEKYGTQNYKYSMKEFDRRFEASYGEKFGSRVSAPKSRK